MIDRIYLSDSTRAPLFEELTKALLDDNDHWPKSWTSILCVPATPKLDHACIDRLLNALVWYLYSPEAKEHAKVINSAQSWFLKLVHQYYADCGIELRERIVRVLEDLVLNWPVSSVWLVPRCCELLVKTGRTDVLQIVITGIEKSDAAYTADLSRDIRCDDDQIWTAADKALKGWEEFKRQVIERGVGDETS